MSSKDKKKEKSNDEKRKEEKSKDDSPREKSPYGSVRSLRSQQSPRSPRKDGNTTARSKSCRERRNPNKIYRCPPTPPPEEQYEMEKSFVLDSNAVSSISHDYSKTNPKLGPILAPYNSQMDRSVRAYFRFDGVDKTLRRSKQDWPGTSIEGRIQDRFYRLGPGSIYLRARNMHGAGRSMDTITGHSEFMSDIKEVHSYNGPFGFRRNTPWLRNCPSPFGTGRSPVWYPPTHKILLPPVKSEQ